MSDTYTYDVSMFRETFETQYTYLTGFLRNVSRFGDRPALHDPQSGRRWTYRTLNAQPTAWRTHCAPTAWAKTTWSCSPC